MKKNISKVFVLILLLCVLMSACAPTSKFARHVKKGEYQKAVSFYRRDLYGKTLLEIESVSFLRNYLSTKWADYLEGKITEEAFSKVLSTVEKIDSQLGLLPEIARVRSNFSALKMSKESFALAGIFLKDKNYLEAIEAFAGVLPEDAENYEEAQKKIQETIEIYESGILEQADERIRNNDYNGAIFLVSEARNFLGESDGLEEFLHDTHTEIFVEKIEHCLADNDGLSLVKAYQEAKTNHYIVISPEMTGKYVAVRNECIQQAIKEAEAVFAEDLDYAGAAAVLKSAQLDLGEDPELQAKLEHYEWHIPVDLVSLAYTEKSGNICVGTTSTEIARDMNETVYNDSTLIYIYKSFSFVSSSERNKENSLSYDLNREYAKLSGVVYRPFITHRFGGDWGTGSGKIEIFGDDSLLYTGRITGDTFDAENFEIDVTGVQKLKIKVQGFWETLSFEYRPIIVVGEMYLTRD